MNSLGPTIVVDASVAVKWLIPEPDSEIAERLCEGRNLIAPELIEVECANILWKHVRRGEISRIDAFTGIQDLRRSPLDLIRDSELLVEAQGLANDFDHPIYDCLYLALALRKGVSVVTADARFARLPLRFPMIAGSVVGIGDLR
ncbi:type II toxin-antitoxin system VapC family toxin [Azospirillum sp.]|uniref:type II toxin-antitoxin system VapC family toxin n=1 Tax=Azospirillum sp. TaxID=34012 RepID=UPI003D74A01C